MNVGFQNHSLGLTCFMCDTGRILAPVYFIALLPPTPKCGNPKQSSYILTVYYLNLRCLHACTISEGNVVLEKKKKIFDNKVDDNPFIFFCNLCMGFRLEVGLFVSELLCSIPHIGIVLY